LKKWLWAGAVAVIVVLAVLARGSREPVVEVGLVATAYPYQNVALLNAAGFVVAQRKASVSTKASGRLEWLGVQEGSAVRTDEVIAKLDDRDVRAQADQAKSNISVAKATLGQAEVELTDARAAWSRSQELRGQNFISQATLDTALARLNKARAGVESARAAVGAAEALSRAAEVAVEQTRIRAPFDGVVLTKNANVGDILTPFSSAAESKGAVVTMADMASLEVEADVSESSLANIKPGQPCEIQLDALPNERFRGRVSRLVPTVDRSKATVLTKIAFIDRDPRVLPEMAAKVVFLSREVTAEERTPSSVISAQALTERGGKPVVFALSGTEARMVSVDQKHTISDAIVVSLKAGERVVLNPPANLADGSRVQLAKKQAP
jgi:RND family efflux transporter MFP subunit